MELLIQRSTTTDDDKGIDEPLQEQDSIVLTHYVKVDYTVNSTIDQVARDIQLHTDMAPILSYGRLA